MTVTAITRYCFTGLLYTYQHTSTAAIVYTFQNYWSTEHTTQASTAGFDSASIGDGMASQLLSQ
jgi:hypothetical protein